MSFREGFLAPAQSAAAFLNGSDAAKTIAASYRPGVYPARLDGIYPPRISSRLRDALIRFDQVLPGFSRDAVLIAPETRTSSPLRVLRHREDLHCNGIRGLYPIGEGSGYTGGIVSSAADGWRLGARLRLGQAGV